MTKEVVLWFPELVMQLEAVIRLPSVVAADVVGQDSTDTFGLAIVHLHIQCLR